MSTPSYTLKRIPRARAIRLVVSHTGEVRVTAPRSALVRDIEAFIRSRAGWIAEHQAKFAKKKPLTSGDGLPGDYSRYKARATKFIRTRVAELAAEHGFTYTGISVRNTTSQWGSCSPEKKLSFTYKLLFLPPHLADAVIIHELAHTKHPHHGKRFWDEVKRALPAYKTYERELKQYLL